MPQITQLALVLWSQWFWLALVLAVIYIGVGMNMVPKIERVVDNRNAKIAGDLAAAERARSEADSAEERVRKAEQEARVSAQGVTSEAKSQAAKESEARLAKADAELAAKLAKAEDNLGKARADALKSLHDVTVEVVHEIVAKISGAKVSASDASAAVKAVLN